MSQRDFEWVKTTASGAARSAFRITCGKCSAKDDFVQAGASRKPPIAAEQFFRRKGWAIGGRSNTDRCPACWGAQSRPSAKYIPFFEKFPICEEDKIVVKAEAPEGPTREDRRIVFAKLQEVYLDEVKGYDVGWTDHRVAQDLGVPRKWVADIRDENFGPTKDNEELREFLGKVNAVEVEVTKFVNLYNEARGVVDVLKVQVADLQKLANNVRNQIAP